MNTNSYLSSQRAIEHATDPFQKELLIALPKLYRTALSITGNSTDAEDLTTETMRRAIEAKQKYTLGTNMLMWATVIMRNQFLSERRRSWRTVLFDPLEFMPQTCVNPQQQHHAELRDLQERVLSKLPREMVDAALLASSGLDYEEIAKLENCAVGTVKSRVFRGRVAIQQLLDSEAPLVQQARQNRDPLDQNKDSNSELHEDSEEDGDSDSSLSEDFKDTENEVLESLDQERLQTEEYNYLFDSSKQFAEIDIGWFVLRVNNLTQTSFIKGTMISFSHDETVAILNLQNSQNGQSPTTLEAIVNKLGAYSPEWADIIQHGNDSYSLKTVTRNVIGSQLSPPQLAAN